jgi:hypothetical protein
LDKNDVIGREIGNYRITAEINSGAFGSVYKAEHIYLHGRRGQVTAHLSECTGEEAVFCMGRVISKDCAALISFAARGLLP